MNRTRMRCIAVLGVAAVAGMVVAAPTPASAVPPPLPVISGVVKVEAPSANNSAMAKSATVTCPAGKRLINASGYIVGGGGKVSMDDIYPDSTTDTVTVTGKETDPLATNWWVSAVATCADEPSGLELISVASALNSFYLKQTIASCTGSKTLIGGGATITGGNGEVILDAIVPTSVTGSGPSNRMTVEATESDPLATDWLVNAFAFCADPLRGQQRLSASTTSASVNDGTRVDCDPGQVETGTGAEIVGVVGEAVIDNAYPVDGSAITAPTATTVYGQEEDGTTGNWYITAFALCADA